MIWYRFKKIQSDSISVSSTNWNTRGFFATFCFFLSFFILFFSFNHDNGSSPLWDLSHSKRNLFTLRGYCFPPFIIILSHTFYELYFILTRQRKKEKRIVKERKKQWKEKFSQVTDWEVLSSIPTRLSSVSIFLNLSLSFSFFFIHSFIHSIFLSFFFRRKLRPTEGSFVPLYTCPISTAKDSICIQGFFGITFMLLFVNDYSNSSRTNWIYISKKVRVIKYEGSFMLLNNEAY